MRLSELRPHNAPITLGAFCPGRGSGSLGPWQSSIASQFVGSMAVPGLCAKPIVDMLLVVEDSVDEPSYVPALEAAGYKLLVQEPDWFEHRFHDWLRANEVDRGRIYGGEAKPGEEEVAPCSACADAKTEIVRKSWNGQSVKKWAAFC